jgi:hypothetical protein
MRDFHIHNDRRPIHAHRHPGPESDPHIGYWPDGPNWFVDEKGRRRSAPWVKDGKRLPGEVTP